jgi:hypothetical protein
VTSSEAPLRQAYDRFERAVAPPLEAVVRSTEFARAGALAARGRRFVTGRVNGLSRWLWHLVNLPAGTDVQRLRLQIGQLDREVRRLTLQLEMQSGPARRVVAGDFDEPA